MTEFFYELVGNYFKFNLVNYHLQKVRDNAEERYIKTSFEE